jgi:hypothetical protein
LSRPARNGPRKNASRSDHHPISLFVIESSF